MVCGCRNGCRRACSSDQPQRCQLKVGCLGNTRAGKAGAASSRQDEAAQQLLVQSIHDVLIKNLGRMAGHVLVGWQTSSANLLCRFLLHDFADLAKRQLHCTLACPGTSAQKQHGLSRCKDELRRCILSLETEGLIRSNELSAALLAAVI